MWMLMWLNSETIINTTFKLLDIYKIQMILRDCLNRTYFVEN